MNFVILYLTCFLLFNHTNMPEMNVASEEKMIVEIWSDVLCPFCYIGKRKFEKALNDFRYKEQVEVRWRSYQLDPSADPHSNENAYAYLARVKGQSLDWSMKMHSQVTAMAAEVGLEYNFDKTKMSNSFKAHKLIQMASIKGADAEMEELLFKAYFTEGKNIGDEQTLVDLAVQAGLNQQEAREAVSSDKYAAAVQNDIIAAEQMGLTGVPYFVFNNQMVVSGAQDSIVFLNALEVAYHKFRTEKAENVKK